MGKIIFCLALFLGLAYLSFILEKERKKDFVISSKGLLVVCYPKFGFFAGIVCAIMSVCVMLGFTLFSYKLPHIIFYCVFCFFLLLGLYLTFKIKNFKLIVEDKQIIVYSITNRAYSFLFQEIAVVTRQTKKTGAERIIIKTDKKRVVVENSAIGYKRFLELIKCEVDRGKLIGF